MRIVPVIVAVIENPKGELLLLKRSPDKTWYPNLWNLVAGKMKDGEAPIEAALREIEEEINIPVELQEEFPKYDVEGEGTTWRTHAFRFRAQHPQPELNDEHIAFEWIDHTELSRFEIVPIMLEDLRQMGYIE